jgi:hypothetical protein
MKGRFMLIKKIGIIFLLALSLAACAKEPEEKKIDLPSHRALTLYHGWGMVLTNYIRLRVTPDPQGVEITALAKYALVRVLDKGKKDTVKGVTDFWYEIQSGPNRGWLFGRHLDVFHTKTEAERAIRQAREDRETE